MDYIELITQSTFFSYVLFGNTLGTWLIGLFVGGATFVGMLSIQRTLVNRIGKFAQSTIQDFDDLLISVVQSIKAPTSLMLSVFIASRMVSIPLVIDTVVFVIFALSLVRQLSISLRIVVSYIIRKQLNEDEQAEKGVADLMSAIATVLVWVFGGLFILSNLGVDVTSLVAGLGIGGLAVALALQNILSDLFSSFSIILDKPFVVGDFIIVGQEMGTVEKIGIKTTRIRALQGEEIVISNQELTTTRVQNFKKLEKRRVVVMLGVEYSTNSEKMKAIPEITKGVGSIMLSSTVLISQVLTTPH